MPNVSKYISRTPAQTSRPGELRPTLLSPNVGQVNLSGGAIRSPGQLQPLQQTPVLNRDLLGPAIAEAGQQIGRAALKFANDRAELEANDRVITYQRQMRELWLGGLDEDGKTFIPGYASTTGKDALEKYSTFQAEAERLREELIQTTDENTASRFLEKTQGIAGAYLNSGAQHAAAGKRVWQQQQIELQGQQLSVDLADVGLSPQAVDQGLRTFEAQLTEMHGPAGVEPVRQGFYQKHARYLSTQPDAIKKLNAFQAVIEGRGDIETQTGINDLVRAVTRQEVTDQRQAEAEADRLAAEARENRGIALRTAVWTGETIPEIDLHKMLESRKIDSSTHDYLVFAQREGRSIPPLLGSDIYRIKNQILAGEVESADLDGLGLNPQDNRSLHDYLGYSRNQQTQSDLQLIRQEIRRLGENPLIPDAKNAVLNATLQAEDIYFKARAANKEITPYEAVQRGTGNYFQANQLQQLSPPPVQVESFTETPRAPAHLDELIKRERQYQQDHADTLTADEIVRRNRVYHQWRAKFAATRQMTQQREQDLQGTTRP